MPFLQIKADQTIQVTVLNGVIQTRHTHWVGKTQNCTGTGCPHCTAGIKQQTRYQMEVLLAGVQKTWEFPETIRTHLVGLSGGDPLALAGKQISIGRTGAGTVTRYNVMLTGESTQPPAAAAPAARIPGPPAAAAPAVSGVLRALVAVVCDPRFAALMAEYLRQAGLETDETEMPY